MTLIRRATIQDVPEIHRLLMDRASHDALVLPRSVSELYSHVRDFVIATEADEVVGCCALTITWSELAEVRSLVVDQRHRGKGIGRKLIDAVMSEALTLGISTVFTLTEQETFFQKMGFGEVEKETLNQKVWADCYTCPRFPDHCNEVAMTFELQSDE